jgi:hypothetical protein
MTVGKPDFDLNSFGVKYLSKDQVQNFLEIKKRKDMGDVGQDPDTPGLEGKEVSTNEITGHKTVRPKPVKRGGFKNRQMRRIVNGKKVKVGQTEEETTPPEGQVPKSRKNDVQYGKLGEESTDQVRESFDYHTNSPKWQEAINRDAALTTEQGTKKFDDTPANRALRDRIAMRNHKKKLAAEKKKKLKKANDIIMDMNIMKLDLMKDSKDGKQSKDGLPKNGELKDLISGDDTREHVAEATRLGNEKRDIDEEFKKRYGFKNTPKNWKHFGRKNRMSGGTKESLKSDLMKDGIQGGGKNVPIPKKDGDEDDTWKQNSRGQGLGETDTIWAGYPFAPPETRPGGRYPEKPDMKGAPKDLKTKADETIFKATSLKLDLMNKKSKFKPSNPLHQNIHPSNAGRQNDPYYKNVDLSVDYDQMSRDIQDDVDRKNQKHGETNDPYDDYGRDL